KAHSQLVRERLQEMAGRHGASVRGRGLIYGIEFNRREIASLVSRAAFERGLLIETAGPHDEVLKLLPPLTITTEALQQGLDIIAESIDDVFAADTNNSTTFDEGTAC